MYYTIYIYIYIYTHILPSAYFARGANELCLAVLGEGREGMHDKIAISFPTEWQKFNQINKQLHKHKSITVTTANN